MTDHTAKVGVVVPIWNVAPYIERCVESLMMQALDDMQFVFVDDASPDNSIDILNTVLARHPERATQVSVVHHEVNKGLPTARKTGLGHINAEYVAHCDSDDWCDPTMYEKMYLSAKSNDADMVICDFYRTNGKKRFRRRNHEPADGDLVRGFLHRLFSPCVWTRLTRTEIYRQVDFPTEYYLEDWVQSTQTQALCQVVNFLHEPLYYYRHNPNSLTKHLSENSCDEGLRQCMANFKFVEDYVLSRNLAVANDLIWMKFYVRFKLQGKLRQRKGRNQYLSTYPEINRHIFGCPYLSLQDKASYLAIYLNLYPEFCRYVWPAVTQIKRLLSEPIKG